MSEYDEDEIQEEPVSGIPEFKWTHPKTGEQGWVTFNDPDDLSGRDIQGLRNTITDAGGGAVTNAFMARALALLVAEWHVPMPDGKSNPIIPRLDKTGKVLGTLPGKFMVALEDHVRPHLDFLKPSKDDEDPLRPARG